MDGTSERITELTWKYIKGELTPEEREELEVWLSTPENRARFEERIKPENILEWTMLWQAAPYQAPDLAAMRGQEADESKIIDMGERRLRVRRRGWWIAAAAIGVVSAGAILWQQTHQNRAINPTPLAVAGTNIPPPVADRAILTLASGETVDLSNAGNGTVAQQQGSEAVKVDNGELAYHANASVAAVENTIATPRGGGYRVVLADGSRVWLNAASKLQFPTAFTGADRSVTLEGEAYIEAVPDARHPFIVRAGKVEVQVLGTSFDLMAYGEEPQVRTVLVTGAVEVSAGPGRIKLTPGLQARVDDNGTLSSGTCDVNSALAWKNGYLDFHGADIQSVMRAVSRWWDVNVQYTGTVSPERFTGQFNRSLTGEQVVQILKASGYNFNISGKTIVVLP